MKFLTTLILSSYIFFAAIAQQHSYKVSNNTQSLSSLKLSDGKTVVWGISEHDSYNQKVSKWYLLLTDSVGNELGSIPYGNLIFNVFEGDSASIVVVNQYNCLCTTCATGDYSVAVDVFNNQLSHLGTSNNYDLSNYNYSFYGNGDNGDSSRYVIYDVNFIRYIDPASIEVTSEDTNANNVQLRKIVDTNYYYLTADNLLFRGDSSFEPIDTLRTNGIVKIKDQLNQLVVRTNSNWYLFYDSSAAISDSISALGIVDIKAFNSDYYILRGTGNGGYQIEQLDQNLSQLHVENFTIDTTVYVSSFEVYSDHILLFGVNQLGYTNNIYQNTYFFGSGFIQPTLVDVKIKEVLLGEYQLYLDTYMLNPTSDYVDYTLKANFKVVIENKSNSTQTVNSLFSELISDYHWNYFSQFPCDYYAVSNRYDSLILQPGAIDTLYINFLELPFIGLDTTEICSWITLPNDQVDGYYLDNNFCFSLDVNQLLGVEENSRTINSFVYPNPFTNEGFSIQSLQKINRVEVYNINGQMVYSEVVNGKTLFAPQLENGIYFIRVVAENGSLQTHKLLKVD